MKCKSLVLLTALHLAFAGSFAYASISVRLADGDTCDNLAGHWSGKGSVSAKTSLGKVHCEYTGNADVSMGKEPHQYLMSVAMNQTFGVCPQHEDFQLSGTCTDGVLTLKAQQADLKGDIINGGTEADMHGTVNVDHPILGKVVANVDEMKLHKS